MLTQRLFAVLTKILDTLYSVSVNRFKNNSSLSNPRKQRELRKLQENQLVKKFEVEVTFNSLNPHPFSFSTRVAHKTTPLPFLVTSKSYLCDAEVPEIGTGQINFLIPTRYRIIELYFNYDKHTSHYIIYLYNTHS